MISDLVGFFIVGCVRCVKCVVELICVGVSVLCVVSLVMNVFDIFSFFRCLWIMFLCIVGGGIFSLRWNWKWWRYVGLIWWIEFDI